MPSFSGTHFEIGRQLGELYKNWGVSFFQTKEQDLLEKQIHVYEQHAPEILEEIRGIARGYGASFHDVANRYLLGEILFIRSRNRRCCTVGGFRDQDGKTWVIRNYDWHPVASKHFQLFQTHLPEVSYTGISDMGVLDETSIPKSRQFFTPQDLVSQHNLFIGITFAYCWKEQIGINSAHIRRLVIERCKTVDEALDLFKKTPVSVAKNFFIADKTGNMAVVQHGVTSFEVRRPNEYGLLAVTNHYVGSLEKEDQIHKASPESTTWKRYGRVLQDMQILSQRRNLSFDDLRVIMNGNETPVFQSCPEKPIETCWTLLMNLPEKDVRLIGNPHAPNARMEKIKTACNKTAL